MTVHANPPLQQPLWPHDPLLLFCWLFAHCPCLGACPAGLGCLFRRLLRHGKLEHLTGQGHPGLGTALCCGAAATWAVSLLAALTSTLILPGVASLRSSCTASRGNIHGCGP